MRSSRGQSKENQDSKSKKKIKKEKDNGHEEDSRRIGDLE